MLQTDTASSFTLKYTIHQALVMRGTHRLFLKVFLANLGNNNEEDGTYTSELIFIFEQVMLSYCTAPCALCGGEYVLQKMCIKTLYLVEIRGIFIEQLVFWIWDGGCPMLQVLPSVRPNIPDFTFISPVSENKEIWL